MQAYKDKASKDKEMAGKLGAAFYGALRGFFLPGFITDEMWGYMDEIAQEFLAHCYDKLPGSWDGIPDICTMGILPPWEEHRLCIMGLMLDMAMKGDGFCRQFLIELHRSFHKKENRRLQKGEPIDMGTISMTEGGARPGNVFYGYDPMAVSRRWIVTDLMGIPKTGDSQELQAGLCLMYREYLEKAGRGRQVKVQDPEATAQYFDEGWGKVTAWAEEKRLASEKIGKASPAALRYGAHERDGRFLTKSLGMEGLTEKYIDLALPEESRCREAQFVRTYTLLKETFPGMELTNVMVGRFSYIYDLVELLGILVDDYQGSFEDMLRKDRGAAGKGPGSQQPGSDATEGKGISGISGIGGLDGQEAHGGADPDDTANARDDSAGRDREAMDLIQEMLLVAKEGRLDAYMEGATLSDKELEEAGAKIAQLSSGARALKDKCAKLKARAEEEDRVGQAAREQIRELEADIEKLDKEVAGYQAMKSETTALEAALFMEKEDRGKRGHTVKFRSARRNIAARKICLIGAEEPYGKQFRATYPGWKHIQADMMKNMDTDMLRGIEKVYFFGKVCTAGDYGAAVRTVSGAGVPFGYLMSTSLEKDTIKIFYDLQASKGEEKK